MGELQKRILQLTNELAKDDKHKMAAEDVVNLLIGEMAKDLVLPRSYMHKSHRHKGKMVNTTAFLDGDLEEFKAKLKKWLAVENNKEVK